MSVKMSLPLLENSPESIAARTYAEVNTPLVPAARSMPAPSAAPNAHPAPTPPFYVNSITAMTASIRPTESTPKSDTRDTDASSDASSMSVLTL